MRRRQTFVDEGTGEAVVLPVTPGSYAWENGIHVETVVIDRLGDLHMAGRKALDTRKVECLFPARRYPFCEPEAKTEPFWYLEWFERRCQAGTVLRYIVSGTPLNAAVLVESIQYSEDDGSNDLKAVLTLRQYVRPEVPAAGQADGAGRSTESAVPEVQSYAVEAGDTLSAVCRRFYGDASLYGKLAAANGIQNPDLICPGQVLTIPPAGQLPAAAPLSKSAKTARATKAVYSEGDKRWRTQLLKEEAAW